MKILVTGAAGFIGSHLTDSLTQAGHQVLALDALVPELYAKSIKERNWAELDLLTPPPSKIFHDLRNSLNPKLLEGVEYVFHLAAIPGLSLSWDNPKLYIDSNLLATSNLMQACSEIGLKKFIYISTSSVYGVSINGDEESNLSPISPYGVTKLAAEKMVQAFANAFAMPYTIVRPFSVYGPRQREDMAFNIFIKKILNNQIIEIYGDGSQTRTNTYVEDLVTGLILAMDGAKPGEIYNLSGSEQYSVKKVVEVLESLIKKEAKIEYVGERLGDQKETITSSEKARQDFGYLPKTKLDEGLQKQISWQKNLLNL